MGDKKTVKISVGDSSYSIVTDDDPMKIQRYAAKLDVRMRAVIKSGVSVAQAAVLCALRLQDEAEEAAAETECLKNSMRAYLEDSAQAKLERDAALREVERLKRKYGAAD